MAVTKILPRNGGLKEAIDYVLNGDKTDGHILTAHFNCDPGREYREMMKTKLETGRLDKRQCYHIIQSFKPGEITPELALEIAKAFAQEHLDGFEGSSEEKKIRAYLATIGLDYDALTKEEFVSLIGILKKSKYMKNPISQRGKARPQVSPGKGKRKKK